jgi:hypothetical protein
MTSGHILFDGKPIQADLIGYKRRMGYVPEEPYLYNHFWGGIPNDGLSTPQFAEAGVCRVH